MAAKMSAEEVRQLFKAEGFAQDEEAAIAWGVSMRSVYNWKKKGCPRKGQSKQLRQRLAELRRKAS